MASWNGTEVVRWPPRQAEHGRHPDWWALDCGCCGGIAWSAGTEPIECDECKGLGWLWVHAPTGTVAEYPGGPLLGARMPLDEVQRRLGQVAS